ncbi:MAG: hypothetical protein L6R41_004949 [Letrouitia leprolyta]|nr:MAG: hypothetical protein L6R41_004949 [Letrouitia leprolyta]
MPTGFLELPGEIRNAIYSLLYFHPRVIFPFKKSTDGQQGQRPDYFRRWQPHPVFHLDFLLTCRQIHDEASAILYSRNTFRFAEEGLKFTIGSYSCVRHFMENIGQDNRRRVRHVELALYGRYLESHDNLKTALALLATCFVLGTLTVTFMYNISMYEFTYVLDGTIVTGRKAIYQQVMLELAATIKAVEQCHNIS